MRKSVLQLVSGNLLSKVFGLGRELLSAALFGTSAPVAAFRVAQTGTLSPVNFLTSDSLNSAFIPLYRRFLTESRDKAQTLLWMILGIFGCLSLIVCSGLWYGATLWVARLAPGLNSDATALTVGMLQIMGVGVPFYLLSAVLMYADMAQGDFALMSIRPVIQNIGLTVGMLAAFLLHDVMLFAWGFTVAYMLFLALVLWRTFRTGQLELPSVWHWLCARDVLSTFWITLRPLLLLPFMLQGNIVIERVVASLIGLVAVAALDYARFVTETLILLISVPVGFAGLSHWSSLETEEMQQRLADVLLMLLLCAVPTSAFLGVYAHLVVQGLYARGAFDAVSVTVTGDILRGTSFGLWAQVLGYVFVKALSAQLRNRTVLWVMGWALLANVLVNLAFHIPLGPITLGLGSSAYGLVLLLLTVHVLCLWRPLLEQCRWYLPAIVLYMLLGWVMPLPSNVWGALVVAGGWSLVYWLVWIASVPSLRIVALTTIRYKRLQHI